MKRGIKFRYIDLFKMNKIDRDTFVQYDHSTSQDFEVEGKIIVANLIKGGGDYSLKFMIKENAEVDLRVLIVTDKGNHQKINIEGTLKESHSKVNLHLIGLVLRGELNLDGWIFIPQGVQKVEGHLLEENILLGDKIKVTSLPRLDVRSNDVVASHWAKIERLDEIKMFYLRSKGLSQKEAQLLLIKGYIESFLEGLENAQEVKEELINYFENSL